MAKLNQIIAIEKGIKSRDHSEVSELYKTIQKPELFNGLSRTYQDNSDSGEYLPGEKKRVQFTVSDVLRHVGRSKTELFNVTMRKDATNANAKSDVIVDGQVILKDAPVTFLLTFEKNIRDIRNFIAALPILDENDNWSKDENSGLFKSDEIKTHRTKKVAKPIVMYPATPEHPAQTQMAAEDIIAGFWTTVKLSGAMPKPLKEKMLARADALLVAVKEAREGANGISEVPVTDVGEPVFGYLFADME